MLKRPFHLCKEKAEAFLPISFLFFSLWKQETHKMLPFMLTGWWDLTSVGQFSNADPILDPELIDTFFFKNVRTGLKTDLRFSHDREPVQMCVCILENRTGSLIELRSGSQSSLYHLIGFLLFFFSLGTATLLLLLLLFFSLTAITFLPLLFFSLYYYYYSSFFTAIAVLSLLLFSLYWYYCSLYYYLLFSHCSYTLFLLLLLFSITWCRSFPVMKSFNY